MQDPDPQARRRGVLTCRSTATTSLDSFFVVDSFVDDLVDAVGAGDALLAYATLSMLATKSDVDRDHHRLDGRRLRMRVRRQRSDHARRRAPQARRTSSAGCQLRLEELMLRVIVVGLGVQGNKRRRSPARILSPRSIRQIRTRLPRPCATCRSTRYDAALCACPTSRRSSARLICSRTASMCWSKSRCGPMRTTALERSSRRWRAKRRRLLHGLQSPLRATFRAHARSGRVGRTRARSIGAACSTATARRGWCATRPGATRAPACCPTSVRICSTRAFLVRRLGEDFRSCRPNRFENCAPDHVVFASDSARPRLEFEMTLLSWRNHFTCDVLAEKGSAHIEFAVQMGPVDLHFAHAHAAERAAARRGGDAGAGRSDLGARIRAFQALVAAAAADATSAPTLAQLRVLGRFGDAWPRNHE